MHVRSVFKGAGVYSSLGATDFYPAHYFDFSEPGVTLDEFAVRFENSTILEEATSDEIVKDEFSKFGYYFLHNPVTQVIDSNGITSSELGIFFLNSAACDNRNYALMQQIGDPGE